ncbi:MAG: hypothetical protein M0P02_04425 [Sulfurospirillaceae bacterium]|jgi:hypothetical protein|nr:hypothetical protein [Sulfurospirillaceae bacterium]MDY0237502.1 hypothetical protein [Campylobacterales bacterium]NLM98627.1 hypothetical protein [Campylobacteraceae bacterium]
MSFKLSTLTHNLKKQTLQYNASLPISIDVLERIGYQRYKLKVGHKQMSTRSMKYLEKGEKYWGNFSETKGGILTINNLKKKPAIMQDSENFLNIDSLQFLDELLNSNEFALEFKKFLLHALKNCNDNKDFFTLTSMLLALHAGIIHLPLLIDDKIFLLQWRENQSLNDGLLDFYFAYENLGAIEGRVDFKKEKIFLRTLFTRTADFLNRFKSDAPFSFEAIPVNEIYPLWEGTDELLNIKG